MVLPRFSKVVGSEYRLELGSFQRQEENFHFLPAVRPKGEFLFVAFWKRIDLFFLKSQFRQGQLAMNESGDNSNFDPPKLKTVA